MTPEKKNLRRCAVLLFEPREELIFDLNAVSSGGSGLCKIVKWIALAPHAGQEIIVTAEEIAALGAISPSQWIDLDEASAAHPAELLDALIRKNLLVIEGTEPDRRDGQMRDTHWRSASAAMHYASRWQGVDTEANEKQFVELVDRTLLQHLGPPPDLVRERVDAASRLRLPAMEPTPLDALLDHRVTCRNFDASRALTKAQFSAVLYRAYGARAVDDFAPGVQLLKKGVPSAGGLHATEAYLLVQRVEGIEPGLYHYHPVDHALEPLRVMDHAEAAALARRFVAAQSYFVGAHVFVIPVSRFRRNFWKYRNHAKAYRALILDVGHLSQTMYLAATELGLAAFITAAVNEIDIEQAFGLDPLEEGPLAVTGFGIRTAERSEVEFDPLHAVWKET
jgi:putative peptide maturation dehydrogenase